MAISSYFESFTYWWRLPWHVKWRTALVQIPRFVPLSVLHLTSPKGPHPFIVALPSRGYHRIPIYVFVPPEPVSLHGCGDATASQWASEDGIWKVPVVLDFHGGGFIMGSPLEQAPYCAMMSRELGAVAISVSYRIGPFNQFPAAIHDAEDVLSAVLDTEGITEGGKVLRLAIQKYYTTLRTKRMRNRHRKTATLPSMSTTKDYHTIKLDPTHLTISGFSAGGNIALNLALSVPAITTTESGTPFPIEDPSPDEIISPLLPSNRRQTIVDDPCQPWPSLLPRPSSQSRLVPMLLFYPSLDARLLPHERPSKTIPGTSMEISKPRAPGLFSIMGPTYLPKKLRAHPRASPGLAEPRRDLHRNAGLFLVLPEKDTLAVQSEVWVDKMQSEGWTGPVRFGAGREESWEGDHIGNAENGGLEVWHSPGMKHGWTQFPDPVLKKNEKRERDLVFERALNYVRQAWNTRTPPGALLGRDGQ